MRSVLAAAAIVLIVCVTTGLATRPASAVDVVNKDQQPRTVTIITPEGRKSVTVPAGGTVQNVCSICTIEAGTGQKRDASGAQKVTVTGPLLLVGGQP